MCSNCYHSNGRFRMAWKCEHTDKKLYALGICATCYHFKYSKTRVKKNLNLNLKIKDQNFNINHYNDNDNDNDNQNYEEL